MRKLRAEIYLKAIDRLSIEGGMIRKRWTGKDTEGVSRGIICDSLLFDISDILYYIQQASLR